jgi:hypothetical protein
MTAAAQDPGTVYLLHFDRPYGPPGAPVGSTAKHYVGWARDLAARLAEHEAGRGARLTEVVRAAGIGWTLARTWPGSRARERQIKNQGGHARHCPECGVKPRPERVARPAPAPSAAAPPPRPAVPPHERGARSAEWFLAGREGQSADQIAAALEYVTGPYRQDGPRSEAAAQEMAAFIATVTAGIKAQRATEKGTEVNADTAHGRQAAGPARTTRTAAELAAEAADVMAQGHTTGQAAERLGVTTSAVQYAFRRAQAAAGRDHESQRARFAAAREAAQAPEPEAEAS